MNTSHSGGEPLSSPPVKTQKKKKNRETNSSTTETDFPFFFCLFSRVIKGPYVAERDTHPGTKA
jgi:hypothetical protein